MGRDPQSLPVLLVGGAVVVLVPFRRVAHAALEMPHAKPFYLTPAGGKQLLALAGKPRVYDPVAIVVAVLQAPLAHVLCDSKRFLRTVQRVAVVYGIGGVHKKTNWPLTLPHGQRQGGAARAHPLPAAVDGARPVTVDDSHMSQAGREPAKPTAQLRHGHGVVAARGGVVGGDPLVAAEPRLAQVAVVPALAVGQVRPVRPDARLA